MLVNKNVHSNTQTMYTNAAQHYFSYYYFVCKYLRDSCFGLNKKINKNTNESTESLMS